MKTENMFFFSSLNELQNVFFDSGKSYKCLKLKVNIGFNATCVFSNCSTGRL